ncbi:MAG: DUF4430 domain-containing protein [Thermoplasmata archaeon]
MRRGAAALTAVVAASLVSLVLLIELGPRSETAPRGRAEATLVIDFGGQTPSHPMGRASVVWYRNGSVEATPGPAVWTIHLELEGATVYDALEHASGVAGFTLESEWYPGLRSHRVTGIAGVRDGTDGRYWQFWVNGAYSNLGADLTPVSDGDLITWGFRAPLQ